MRGRTPSGIFDRNVLCPNFTPGSRYGKRNCSSAALRINSRVATGFIM